MAENDPIRDDISKVADVLIQRGVATPNTICGCTAQEIAEIESDVSMTLPCAYRDFLRIMGRDAGEFFLGTDMFYPRLRGITKSARDLVAEDPAGIVLPMDAVAFLMHQGYQFMFIRVGEGDDPPVYHYMERSGEFVKKADTLSGFLFDVAHDDW